MYDNINVTPPPPGTTVCQIMISNINISSTFDEVSHSIKKKTWKSSDKIKTVTGDPRARLSPVPSPVSCPVVSDDVQFKLQISNLKSLDIIHDALHF